MTTPVYEPDDDSYLLLQCLDQEIQNLEARGKTLPSLHCVDMGCGNGFLGFSAMKKGLHATFVDINPEAIAHVRHILASEDISAPVIQSDLFANVPLRTYDIIVFNTPYLPADKELFDPALHGGVIGNETAIRFIEQAKNFLSKDGFILLLTSDIARPKKLLAYAEKMGFSHEQIGSEKLFFEELLVYKIK